MTRLASALAGFTAPVGRRGFVYSAGAGGLAALGQAPLDLWPLALLGFALIYLRAQDAQTFRQTFWRGWAAGLGYFALALSWIVEPFLVDLARHGWMAPFALILMAGGLALFWGAAGMLAQRLGGGAIAWIAALTGAELLRSYIFTGFPWALIGHLWIPTPVAQWASFVGPHGLTALALAVAVSLACFATQPRLAASGVAAATLLWFGGLALLGAEDDLAGRPVVRLVQPNAPQHQKWDPAHIPTFFRRQIEATAALPRPDLTIWPETSVPVALNRLEETQKVMAQAAQGVPLVFGIQRYEDRKVFNTAAVLQSDGTLGPRYDKYHLVPFGEYVPFGNLLARFGIHGLAATQGNGFSAGPAPQVMDLEGLGKALPLICYEAVFPNDVNAAPERPDFLMQLTNDAWFGQISGPYQHLAQARLRAIEQGLPLIRAANTGVSAVIDAKGRVLAELPLGVAGHLDYQLPAANDPTFYSRTGDYFAALAMIAALLVVFVFNGALVRRNDD